MQRWLSKPLNMSKQLFNSGEIAISAHYHALLGARFVFSVFGTWTSLRLRPEAPRRLI
jgi:hypothetical protein